MSKQETPLKLLVFVMDGEGARALPKDTMLSQDVYFGRDKTPSWEAIEDPWAVPHETAGGLDDDMNYADGRRAFAIDPDDFRPVN